MVDFDEAKELYGEEKMNKLRDDVFRDIISKGFSFLKDSYLSSPNILYSKKKGIQLIDYGWMQHNGICNPFPALYKRHIDDVARDNAEVRGDTEMIRQIVEKNNVETAA